MRNFYLDKPLGTLNVQTSDGSWKRIFLTENSGRIVRRNKIDSISGVTHPGVWVGQDKYGIDYVLHNHYLPARIVLDTYADYAQGHQTWWDKPCTNSRGVVLEQALLHYQKGQRYNILTNNCQTYTNDVCHNRRNSEDVDKWIGIAAGLSLLFLAMAALDSSGNSSKRR